MFTWGCSTMDDYYNDLSATPSCADCMVQSSLEGGLLRKRKAKSGYTTFRFNRQVNVVLFYNFMSLFILYFALIRLMLCRLLNRTRNR